MRAPRPHTGSPPPRAVRGDLQGAWDAAQAGWVRAPLSAGRAEAVRADLDQLVVRGIVPDRARALAQPVDALRLAVGAVQGTLEAVSIRAFQATGRQRRGATLSNQFRVILIIGYTELQHVVEIAEQPEIVARTAARAYSKKKAYAELRGIRNRRGNGSRRAAWRNSSELRRRVQLPRGEPPSGPPPAGYGSLLTSTRKLPSLSLSSGIVDPQHERGPDSGISISV